MDVGANKAESSVALLQCHFHDPSSLLAPRATFICSQGPVNLHVASQDCSPDHCSTEHERCAFSEYDDSRNVSFTKDLSEAELTKYEYAILSHTWGSVEEEVTYDDVINGIGTSKLGIGSEKIRFCVDQSKRDGLGYFWVDTCCIDKRNLVELSRALISMFRWYSNANKCYAFLSDVAYAQLEADEKPGSKSWRDDFHSSRWFTRGWTLQELLAPHSLDFFSYDRHHLGTKASLGQVISEITRIPVEVLHGEP